MNSLINLLKFSIITAIISMVAGSAYSQTDEEVVSYFVKEQLEVKDNQTVFNVFRIENRTDRPQKIQVNITAPVDWELFGDRTFFLDIPAHKDKSIPVRIAPSTGAKGGVGYALNASLLTMDGNTFASKYCFLTVPVKTDLKIDYSALSYYLDHRYGRANVSLKIKNDGNSNQLVGIKLFCDEHINFAEIGLPEYNNELSLAPGMDTTIRTMIRYDDMIENISQFNKSLIAEISTKDTLFTKYSFIKYLDYKYDHYIDDLEQPLLIEASILDILSSSITYKLMVSGKLKFNNQRQLSYYYRSQTGPLKNIPNWKYDEYFVKYKTNKNTTEVGNLRDDYSLSLFGPGLKYQQTITDKTYIKMSAIDDIYSHNHALAATFGHRIKGSSLSFDYLKMINDTSHTSYMDMCGMGANYNMRKAGNIKYQVYLNRYTQSEYAGKNGIHLTSNYYNHIGKLSLFVNLWHASPYSATYNHGRSDLTSSISYRLNKRSYLNGNFSRYKYQPASIYNNWSLDLNYKYNHASVIYNYVVGSNSTLYAGPNTDYGTSNYYGSKIVDKLRLASIKAEIGYRYTPNTYILQSLNINMQVGQVKPFSYCDTLPDYYYGENNNVLKFSTTVQGKRWGVYGMYYSGLYNMSMALTNYYTGTAGKYLFFMPYYRITTANKKFYYEIRFSYLNNIDLKNTRTSIMQEAGADFGHGWSMRIQNNTNIQALQDATGQSYRYTSNYMELTVRKVFRWNQPGQKYHTLRTVFYRDLDGDRTKGDNEPGVENVVMSINNNSTIDTSYHFTGEMFGNVDVASNYKGYTEYKNIPEAQYYLKFMPTDEQNERYNIQENDRIVTLDRDMTIYVPFVERNLVFGTVRFNRAKRSAIQELNLDGIKVAITDSHGQSWYAFTDQNGHYEIYAPVADFYTVQIVSNIWSEYFDLRQDKYIIKFNGYKRFEVNFEFDEKTREIVFDDVTDIDDIVTGEDFKFEDISQIKQTILRGTVSDENTLAPLQATIEILDLARHDVVTKLKSSSTNGSFFTTFITGNNYQLRISAPGYWRHQEPLSAEQLTTFETINRDGLMLKRINVGRPMDLHDLLFNENSADLTPEAKAELEDVVILLANNENVNISLVGYCSNKENDPNSLSQKRARKVMEFLVFRGIQANRMTIEGRGANGNNKNSALFRKVDIVVTSNK